ncbi:MAG: hypothetical protein KF841_12525 [Phycisphaerae bacterium]|nr:hypothetical protein [Phycisphaerae bacterium]
MQNEKTSHTRENWIEQSGFTRLFRALSITFSPSLLAPAFIGVLLTGVAGTGLDWIWPTKSKPAAARIGGASFNELEQYLASSGSRDAMSRFVASANSDESTGRAGIFELLALHTRRSVNALTEGAVSLSPGAILGALLALLGGLGWLITMHAVYAVIFLFALFAIWAVCGGAVCRSAALIFSRDADVSTRESIRFARSRWTSFFIAPLIPLVLLAGIAFALWVIGLFGAIPAIGEFFVGVGFIFPIMLGLAAAVCLLAAILLYPLLAPGIASDDLLAGDSLSTAGEFVVTRPIKYLLFLLTSITFGAVCVMLLKIFIATALWLTATFLGDSMNWGSAFALDADGVTTKAAEHKLSALWQAPRPGDGRPFYGTFDGPNLRHVSRFAAVCIHGWILVLWGVVAAFAISFFHASGTIVYFIMRRDIYETDIEEVYLDRADSGAPLLQERVS